MTNQARTIGIIMDGNRRYASSKGLPLLEGHRLGLEKAKEIARAALDAGVTTLYLYAFSTENWSRTPEEVSYLMQLFEQAITKQIRDLAEEKIRVRFIGDLSRLPTKLAKAAHELEETTKDYTRGTLVIALSYGGRSEIVRATNALIEKGTPVTEEDFQTALWTKDLPDPDLIIRTSGEHRLSGFLTWQSVYSELIFTDTLWPEYTKEEFLSHLEEFSARQRRYGV